MSDPFWGTVKFEPLHDLSRGVVDDPVKIELRSLKTVRLHAEITFFE